MRARFIWLFLAWVTLSGSAVADTVEPFLAEIINEHPAVRDLTISGDGQELYYTGQSLLGEVSAILRLKKTLDGWSSPELASFSGNYRDLEPFLSPDGLRLYFASNRPRGEGGEAEVDFDIWYVERESREEHWSDPVNLGKPVNSDANEFYPAVSENGNLYFTGEGPGSMGKDDIFFSRLEGDLYADPVPLGEAINSTGYEFNAYIDPEESCLIFSGYNRPDGMGSADLYISYRQEDGGWSTAKNLGPGINSDKMDYCPFLDVSSGTLYFTSKRSELPVEPFNLRSADDLLRVTGQPANGQSRIYRVKEARLIREDEE